ARAPVLALSLHDALPIYVAGVGWGWREAEAAGAGDRYRAGLDGRAGEGLGSDWAADHGGRAGLADGEGSRIGAADVVGVTREGRSEEHTSELQSHLNLVC